MGIEIDLSGRTVLVTGGTRGIGAGIAEVFRRAGAEVHVCSRNRPEGLPSEVVFHSADVRDTEQVDSMLAAIGRLDVVVNNAGGSPPADTASASIRFHTKVIELNLVAPLLVSQRAYPRLSDGGSIIMIGSVSGCRASPGTAAYGAAKAGLENLASTLAVEFAPRVRVNTVTVGLARTENTAQHYGEDASAVDATVPMGRLAEPVDVGNACAFLASPLAAHITGAALAVHGGGEPPPYLGART